MAPYRERYEGIRNDRQYLEDVLSAGAHKARQVALPVMDRARSRCGFPTRRSP
jgi:hypothetical protein